MWMWTYLFVFETCKSEPKQRSKPIRLLIHAEILKNIDNACTEAE